MVAVKLYFQDEIRRFRFPAGKPGVQPYDTLIQKITNVVPEIKLEESVLCWKDSDGDLINFGSDAEVREALRNLDSAEEMLRIYIFGKGQEKPHPAADTDKENVHPDIKCDGCNGEVTGTRYKCMICADFDLCGACETKHTHDEHPMMRITSPDDLAWKALWRHGPRRRAAAAAGKTGKPVHGPPHPPMHGPPDRFFLRFGPHPGPWGPRGHPMGPRGPRPGMFGPRGPWHHGDPRGHPPHPPPPEYEGMMPPPPHRSCFGGPPAWRHHMREFNRQMAKESPMETTEEAITDPPSTDEDPEILTTEEKAPEVVIEDATLRGPKEVEGDDESPVRHRRRGVAVVKLNRSASPRALRPRRFYKALNELQAMGFGNENGWLARLLMAKNGSVEAVLETMRGPSSQH